MKTHNILSCRKKENRKYISIMPLDLALLLTLVSSNFSCLEHIFMAPKVFEPLKFYYNKVSLVEVVESAFVEVC